MTIDKWHGITVNVALVCATLLIIAGHWLFGLLFIGLVFMVGDDND